MTILYQLQGGHQQAKKLQTFKQVREVTMKVLLDTNIVIHRETSNTVNDDIGALFYWLDKLQYTKCVHRVTFDEIQMHQDKKLVHSMSVKLQSYELLQTEALIHPLIQLIIQTDKDQNDKNDSRLLNELFCGRVDLLITEDKGIHAKANSLSISNKVFTIESFLEKAAREHPGFIDYKILSVRRDYFGNISINDPFFDQFREDYQDYIEWFNKKANEQAYVCRSGTQIIGFLYLKEEREGEDYTNINPPFRRAKRLKIGCFKVVPTHFRLGERFIKIIFDNALKLAVEEIYVTVFPRRAGQLMLIRLLQDWGFVKYGIKQTSSGIEDIYVRDFRPSFNSTHPNLSFPYISLQNQPFLVPIYPDYHTELFPDSILRSESPIAFVENQPHRNSIRKVYISRSLEKNLHLGDIVIFYRTGGLYKGVASTIGMVESVINQIKDSQEFINQCKQRSVFTDKELLTHWNYKPHMRPFIVNFLYVYSLPKRPNLQRLIELGIIHSINEVPRGFTPITRDQFRVLLKEAQANESLIVDKT